MLAQDGVCPVVFIYNANIQTTLSGVWTETENFSQCGDHVSKICMWVEKKVKFKNQTCKNLSYLRPPKKFNHF